MPCCLGWTAFSESLKGTLKNKYLIVLIIIMVITTRIAENTGREPVLYTYRFNWKVYQRKKRNKHSVFDILTFKRCFDILM